MLQFDTAPLIDFPDPDAGKSPEQLVQERQQRVMTTIQLQQPDRVPILLGMGYLLAEMGGITKQELYDNPQKAQEVLEAAAKYYGPDLIMGAWHTPGPSAALGDRMTKWPGYGLDANGSFQFNEQEFMKAEDYDALLEDISDWAIRVYLPRAFKELEGLALLPPLGMSLFGCYNFQMNGHVLTLPPVVSAFQALQNAGQAQMKWLGEFMASTEGLAKVGVPPFFLLANMCEAPFDTLGDTMRGTRGIMLDMYRQPDKLIAAMERLVPIAIEMGVSGATAANNPIVFIPLHKGADGFMSNKDFKKFYWPTLKAVLLGLIEAGTVPYLFVEGGYNQRLDIITDPDIPAGHAVWMFDQSDMIEVKKKLSGWATFGGNVPASLLKTGTPAEVSDYVKKLIDDVAGDGSFILANGAVLDDATAENVHAMIDTGKEYGVY